MIGEKNLGKPDLGPSADISRSPGAPLLCSSNRVLTGNMVNRISTLGGKMRLAI